MIIGHILAPIPEPEGRSLAGHLDLITDLEYLLAAHNLGQHKAIRSEIPCGC